ncbi:MAG: hypothetical protein ACREBG_13685 [Pyrinomonadaceae bacterium]
MEAIEGVERGLESMKHHAERPADNFFQDIFADKGISETQTYDRPGPMRLPGRCAMYP